MTGVRGWYDLGHMLDKTPRAPSCPDARGTVLLSLRLRPRSLTCWLLDCCSEMCQFADRCLHSHFFFPFPHPFSDSDFLDLLQDFPLWHVGSGGGSVPELLVTITP